MASVMLSSDIIGSIESRAQVPIDRITFTNERLLLMATEEINIGIMSQLIKARGDYLVYSIDVPLDPAIKKYQIPARAYGNKLRECSIVDADGNTVWEMSQITMEDLSDYDFNFSSRNGSAFYIENNFIVPVSANIQTGQFLRMYFYLRPNALVLNNRGGTISSISDGVEGIIPVKVVSFSTLPKHFSTAIKYDITAAASPNKVVRWDLSPVAVNTTLKTVSFPIDSLTDVIVGDYLTQAEETIVPNVPTEYHPIIAQRVAIMCLEAMGDEQNKQSAERKLARMETDVLSVITSRVEGAPKKIKNRHGTINQGLGKLFRRW